VLLVTADDGNDANAALKSKVDQIRFGRQLRLIQTFNEGEALQAEDKEFWDTMIQKDMSMPVDLDCVMGPAREHCKCERGKNGMFKTNCLWHKYKACDIPDKSWEVWKELKDWWNDYCQKPVCTRLPVLFFVDEIDAGEYKSAVGFGLQNVPFYDPETGEQLGVYNDAATQLPNSNECLVQSSFSFGFRTVFDDIINLQFTCRGKTNSIVGGSGKYACASGYEEIAFEDESILGTDLILCGSTCDEI